jgi:hypothetical protein
MHSNCMHKPTLGCTHWAHCCRCRCHCPCSNFPGRPHPAARTPSLMALTAALGCAITMVQLAIAREYKTWAHSLLACLPAFTLPACMPARCPLACLYAIALPVYTVIVTTWVLRQTNAYHTHSLVFPVLTIGPLFDHSMHVQPLGTEHRMRNPPARSRRPIPHCFKASLTTPDTGIHTLRVTSLPVPFCVDSTQ